ncbi:uncharacterized protein LOC123547616 isoform X2 [Mercenaria mercenaria]|uniref:uncharacterized protein LOC123547616 isoform X2 n=1 Tax=Mercenaria mercenaria TaxID=6596 RepID=UPI00234EEEAD|nr:uncharacterized protein LOC123547616 isoform X2 [Mercenaria mercenaria]
MDHDDLDEDIERLKIILQDEEGEEEGDSDGELRVLENNEEEYYSNASRPSTSSDVTASSFPTTSVCTDADDAVFRFDPNTITAETCLAMNRAYQEVLLDTLRQIEISLMENRNRQKELEENVDEKVKKTDKQTNKEFYDLDCRHMPYFKDKDGQVPPYNDDVKQKEQMNEEKQHVKPKTIWSKKQRKMLMDAVKLDALEQAVRPLLNKQEVEMEKLGRCKNTEEIQETKARIEKIQQDIKQKQETPADELLKSCDNKKIDFLKIAVITFGNKFSVTECESMWNTVLRPEINRDKWTPAEEEDLNRLAIKYEMRNWSKIAEELGSNRTPFQCLQHYQQHNIVYDNSEWTEEEDELLKEVVETCTYGLGRVKWFQVAYYIDRRSPEQCHSRWNKIDPNRTCGRWSKEEDLQLVNAIHIHGGVADWNKIKELVPTRSAIQCRERFVYRLSGDVLFKPWTYEDDKKLLQLHQIHGSNWTRIAMEFEGRNDNMLLVRYKRLMKWQQLSEGFYSQSKKVQKQLKHPAFKFGSGAIVPKSGLKLRWGKPGHPRKGETPHVRRRHKTEIEKLKEIGGRDAKDSDDDNNDDDNDDIKEEEDVEEEEEEEDKGKTRSLREMQDSLDAFLVLYNIQAYDYYKQIADRELGNLVVPRPPPIRRQKMNVGQALWKKQDKLQDVVATQIDAYIRNIQTKLQDETSESSPTDLNLYDQISKNIKKGNEEEKRRMINAAFGGKNPCNLSVRELLNISKCIKDHGRPPKNPKRYNMEPWEVAESEEEEPEDEESSEFELEQEEEEKPKEKRPRSEKQIAHAQAWKLDVRKHHAIKAQIKRLVQSKMDPKELNKGRGRRKQFLMYPKHVLMKYKGFEEERRLNRKSLVLLMKTLDLDSKKAFFKAKKGKRKVSAMALLKATEKANLKRAKTRRQKTEIQEAARTEANMNSEISEVSDYLLELRDELKIEDDESDENMSVDESGADEEDSQGSLTFGYNKSLPYIPPNKTNILGMRSLLLEHRYLIDEAGMYFNPEDLKEKLYRLKQRGPNPLMGVLNAIGKTENAARRREKEKKGKSELTHVVCKKQLDRVRRTTDYQKLQARFHSVFTWPALLATIQPPKGKPIPLSLQALTEQSKLKEGQVNAEPSDEAVVQAESVTEEDMEGLSEEQAVEKLVDKIMEEYEKERGKKKRHLPTKKYRHFSEKRKQGLKDKERTKILKRLGLYEKMQEFKRRRLEGELTTPVSDAAATAESTASIIRSATETETEENSADNISTASLPVHSTNDTELNASETAAPVMNSSEGCQVDFPPDDFGMTDAVVKTEVLPKRKRGRPPGSKTKCFTDKSPVRKSRRAADSPNLVVKLEQDYELSPPKKKTQSTKRKTQYNFVRTLIPDKMSKIASQIPEIPILNEPIPEKTLKPPKKPKVEKPVKQIFRSKFAQELAVKKKKREEGEFDKRGPKLGRILKQLKEAEAAPAEAEKEAAPVEAEKDAALPSYVQIKTEPLDSDDEDYTANINNYNGTVTAQNSVNNLNKAEKTSRKETEMPVSEVVTSGLKQSLQKGKGMLTKAFDKNLNSVTTQNQGITQEQKDIKNSSADINDKQCAIDVTPETEMVQSQKLQSQNVQSQNVLSQNENQQISNGPEGRKPLIIAVPVTIGGTQQVACVPFYPDDEGKITLPNGKKIDASGAGQQGAVSLPMLNFDQPLQILNPSQPSVNTDSAKDQTGASLLNQSTSVLNQGTSVLNQGASVPNSDATNASSKTN